MANYETPITSRASGSHIHVYDSLGSSHTYMDFIETFKDSNCHYPFSSNTTRQRADVDLQSKIAHAHGDRKLERNNLKTRLWLPILVFVFGVIIGASVTASLFLIVPEDSPPDDATFESPPGNKTFGTPEVFSLRMIRCDIGDTPFKEHRISFSVKTCTDAYLFLTSEYGDTGPLLEIAFGINGNTLSAIRGGGNHVEYVSAELDCRSFKTFWITWMPHDIIRVGRDGESSVFMSKMDNRNLNFVNIGISTGRGSRGEWLFTKV